jgi:hypothetical protein
MMATVDSLMFGYIFGSLFISPMGLSIMSCRIFSACCAVFLIVGCSSTGVIPVDRDSYMIGKKDGYPGLGVSLSNKAEVYQEANSFCNGKDQDVETLNLVVTPAAPGRLGSTELRFKCVSRGVGSAKPHVRESDQILEIRTR